MKKVGNLDLITIGRSSVDLYGSQIGGRLEDMRSFQKYIGGSPTNIAAGAARLGLKSAVITRVGNEHMGRFILEELKKEGVNTEGIRIDKKRLTALVILGIKNQNNFPLIFYRENCADMALSTNDIDENFISRAKCICVTGTHLSNANVEGATLKALSIAKKLKKKTVLDIDFRPNLWGLSDHNDGENRFIESRHVTKKLQKTLKLFDLIVGTEEEFHIAGGINNTIKALKNVRSLTKAVLVCKRGPYGASLFENKIKSNLEKGITGKNFKIDVFNVLGAGDGFMAGLLRGWLRNNNWETCLDYANACGAIAVSRHGCTPSYPSWKELSFFLKRGIKNHILRKDQDLENIHWSTTRGGNIKKNLILAFDHRVQFEELAKKNNIPFERISLFKNLCFKASLKVANKKGEFGIICDDLYGREILHKSSDYNLWIARPAELPKSFPVEFGNDVGENCYGLIEWPKCHIVKLLCFYNPKDSKDIRSQQEKNLISIFKACRQNNLEFLLEIITSREYEKNDEDILKVIDRLYRIGIRPDWWKLEPLKEKENWLKLDKLILEWDQFCRGILLLGLDKPMRQLSRSFKFAQSSKMVKGFAVGRSIFGKVAEKWFSGKISDSEATKVMSDNFYKLCAIWNKNN